MAEHDQEEETIWIQALHYREPEVILGAKYGRQVDMWSFGIILTELFIGKTILESSDESDQLVFLEVCSRAKKFIKDGEPCYADVRSSAIMRAPPSCRELSSVLNNCENGHFLDFMLSHMGFQSKAYSFTIFAPSFSHNKIPSPDDNEKSAFARVAEASQPDKAASRGTYEKRRVSNKRKRLELD